MQKTVLEQICAKIYTEINEILLNHIGEKVTNTTRVLIHGDVIGYLKAAHKNNLINLMPMVEVNMSGPNVILSFHDPETGNKIESLEDIVKLPATWMVNGEMH